MTAALDDLGRDVLLRPDERVGAEVGDAYLRIDERGTVGRHVLDPRRCATGFGLLRKVKVGKHDVAGLMEENVCASRISRS